MAVLKNSRLRRMPLVLSGALNGIGQGAPARTPGAVTWIPLPIDTGQ